MLGIQAWELEFGSPESTEMLGRYCNLPVSPALESGDPEPDVSQDYLSLIERPTAPSLIERACLNE